LNGAAGADPGSLSCPSKNCARGKKLETAPSDDGGLPLAAFQEGFDMGERQILHRQPALERVAADMAKQNNMGNQNDMVHGENLEGNLGLVLADIESRAPSQAVRRSGDEGLLLVESTGLLHPFSSAGARANEEISRRRRSMARRA
jgi:hypothetical protein